MKELKEWVQMNLEYWKKEVSERSSTIIQVLEKTLEQIEEVEKNIDK